LTQNHLAQTVSGRALSVPKDQTKLQLKPVCNIYPDDSIWIRFQSAWWLAKRNLAIRNFGSLVECMLSIHGYKATAYCDDKAAWEIIILIAKWLRSELKTRLKDSLYYGIAVDETTDKSTTSQLIIYVKYLKKDFEGNLVVTIEYLDLIPLNGNSALDITVRSHSVNKVNSRLVFKIALRCLRYHSESLLDLVLMVVQQC
jgi:hypothetical protein